MHRLHRVSGVFRRIVAPSLGSCGTSRLIRPGLMLSNGPVRAMCSHDDFKPKTKAPAGSGDVQTWIDKVVKGSDVVLFMKGTPAAPQCGFSMQVVRVLNAQGIKFDSVNVLENADVRQGIKDYSGWPTIPQLFVKSELVGGCDIVTSMHQSGELETLLAPYKQG